jgi:hypothetical protein
MDFIRWLELKQNRKQKAEHIYVAPPYWQIECVCPAKLPM